MKIIKITAATLLLLLASVVPVYAQQRAFVGASFGLSDYCAGISFDQTCQSNTYVYSLFAGYKLTKTTSFITEIFTLIHGEEKSQCISSDASEGCFFFSGNLKAYSFYLKRQLTKEWLDSHLKFGVFHRFLSSEMSYYINGEKTNSNDLDMPDVVGFTVGWSVYFPFLKYYDWILDYSYYIESKDYQGGDLRYHVVKTALAYRF